MAVTRFKWKMETCNESTFFKRCFFYLHTGKWKIYNPDENGNDKENKHVNFVNLRSNEGMISKYFYSRGNNIPVEDGNLADFKSGNVVSLPVNCGLKDSKISLQGIKKLTWLNNSYFDNFSTNDEKTQKLKTYNLGRSFEILTQWLQENNKINSEYQEYISILIQN